MKTIGFSTGAVALGNFRLAIDLMNDLDVNAIELSALRFAELDLLVKASVSLDLRHYKHIAFHAPSRFNAIDEANVIKGLLRVAENGWLIIVHPDCLVNWCLWKPLEPQLCFENMDKRKPIGRTADELDRVFRFFPNATLCFDIGHAHQIDRTMTEARLILQRFGKRIRQMHVSEVNTSSEHKAISIAFRIALRKVIDLIEDDIPLIIESVVSPDCLEHEVRNVTRAFSETISTLLIPD